MTMFDGASAEIISFCDKFDYDLRFISDGGRFALACEAEGARNVAVFATELFAPGGFERLKEATKSGGKILAHDEIKALMFTEDEGIRYAVLDCLDISWLYISKLTEEEATEWLTIITAVAQKDYGEAEGLSIALAGRTSNPYLKLYPNLIRYEREYYQGMLDNDPACIAGAINKALPISVSTSTPLLSLKGLLDDFKAGTNPETIGLFSDDVLSFLNSNRDVMRAQDIDIDIVDREIAKRERA